MSRSNSRHNDPCFAALRRLVALHLHGLTGVLLVAASLPARGGESPPSPEVVRELQQFDSSWPERIPADNARFGIVRVLSFFNLDFPGLEQVKAAAEAKQYDTAERELLAYFKKTRGGKADAVRSVGPQEQRHANDALRHYFRGNKDVHPPVFRGARIDWTGRAVVDGREIHDGEWYLQFQRLSWWPALARTYAATGDERFFHEWRFELVRWSEDLLPFTKKTPGFVTRGMETYGRCEIHISVLPHMLRSKDFDSKTLLYYLVSFHDQAEHIPRVYASQGNHRLGELSQVFRNGMAFPEFKRAEAWKTDALTLLPRMMTEAVYDDGMNKELVFSYHTMYIGLFAQAYHLFRQSGYEKRLPQDFYPRLLKMADIYAMQSFPDFTVCQFGDAWKKGDAGFVFRKDLVSYAADIPYYDYMVSGGRKGTPPSRRNAVYPESGFYFFRSAWSRDAVFMPLKCSPEGEWHNQIDNGTFELSAYGRNLMTDSGCYIYGSSSPEDQRWRAWFRSTKAHQTLTLDNRDIDRKPTHLLWSESDNLAALAVENQSYAGLKHRRTVLFIANRYFLIHDEALGGEAGDVRIHFQFAPCEFDLHGQVAQTRNADEANLRVETFPLGWEVVSAREEGWISYEIGKMERRPAWSWMIRKPAGEPRVEFLTALVACPRGESPASVYASVAVEGDIRVFTVKEGTHLRKIRVDLAKKAAGFLPVGGG